MSASEQNHAPRKHRSAAVGQRIRPRSALLIVAALFFCLPDLHVIDLLPDTIGLLILLRVIAPYAVIDSHIAEAQRYLEHLLLISVGQLVSVPFILLFLAPSPQEQPMAILLCCFVFSFFRIKTVFPLTKELGDGLMYLDTRNDGTMFCRPHTRRLRGGRVHSYSYSVTDRMMRAIRTFTVATSVLSTLPELAALTHNPTNPAAGIYPFISLLRGTAMMVALVFGVVFLCRMIRFAREIGTDLSYYRRLNDLYLLDEQQHPERNIQKYLRRTFVLVTLFAVFIMDFSVDRINVLPDFLGALLLLAALYMLRRYLPGVKRAVLVTLLYGIASAAHYVVSTGFFMRYHPESILRNLRIRQAYIPVQILSVVEALLMAATLLCLFRMLGEIVDRYTGYEIEGTANYSREQKLREEHDALKRALIPSVVAAFAAVLCGPLYVFLRPTVEFVWLFGVIVPAVFALLLANWLMRLQDSVDSRFMLK